VPYRVVAVVLDDGPFLIGRFDESAGPDVEIGDRVDASFRAVTDDVTILEWRRSGAP
jgi:hypothetical protein